jgi:hypothetical protein
MEMESKGEGHHRRHIPDHVAQYFAHRTLDELPERAYEVIVSLTPEEIEVLEKVGAALGDCEPELKVFALH